MRSLLTLILVALMASAAHASTFTPSSSGIPLTICYQCTPPIMIPASSARNHGKWHSRNASANPGSAMEEEGEQEAQEAQEEQEQELAPGDEEEEEEEEGDSEFALPCGQPLEDQEEEEGDGHADDVGDDDVGSPGSSALATAATAMATAAATALQALGGAAQAVAGAPLAAFDFLYERLSRLAGARRDAVAKAKDNAATLSLMALASSLHLTQSETEKMISELKRLALTPEQLQAVPASWETLFKRVQETRALAQPGLNAVNYTFSLAPPAGGGPAPHRPTAPCSVQDLEAVLRRMLSDPSLPPGTFVLLNGAEGGSFPMRHAYQSPHVQGIVKATLEEVIKSPWFFKLQADAHARGRKLLPFVVPIVSSEDAVHVGGSLKNKQDPVYFSLLNVSAEFATSPANVILMALLTSKHMGQGLTLLQRQTLLLAYQRQLYSE